MGSKGKKISEYRLRLNRDTHQRKKDGEDSKGSQYRLRLNRYTQK